MKRVMYLLFLVFASSNLYGQTYSTVGEVHNFDIGDEFHYVRVNYGVMNDSTYSQIVILDRYISNGYLFYEREITYINSTGTTTIIRIDSFAQNSLNLSIFDPSQLPSGTVITSMSAGTSASHYNRKMNNIDYNDGSIEPTYYTYQYLEGCGLYYMWDIYVTGSSSTTMTYYKKGNEVWGNPVTTNVRELPKGLIERPFITPNPASDKATINFELSLNAKMDIRLYDLSGEELKGYQSNTNFSVGKQQLTLNLSSLTEGMYFCRILVNGELVTLKLVK